MGPVGQSLRGIEPSGDFATTNIPVREDFRDDRSIEMKQLLIGNACVLQFDFQYGNAFAGGCEKKSIWLAIVDFPLTTFSILKPRRWKIPFLIFLQKETMDLFLISHPPLLCCGVAFSVP
jgi:hypothetical protein